MGDTEGLPFTLCMRLDFVLQPKELTQWSRVHNNNPGLVEHPRQEASYDIR